MQSSLRTIPRSRASIPRAFSTSARNNSFARLTICGNLIKSPERSTDRNGKPFIKWTVATDSVGPKKPDGSFGEKTSTFHNVLQFFNADKDYNLAVPKGSLISLEADYKYSSEKLDDGTYKDKVLLVYNKHDVLKRGKTEEGSVPTGAPLQNQNIFGNNV